jgi:tyrosine-protein kinase
MNTTHTEHATTDLRQYVGVLRRRKWSIILITLLFAGAAVLWSLRETPIYRASLRMVLLPQVSAVQSNGNLSRSAPDPNTEKEIVNSVPVAEQVQKDTHTTVPVATLLKHVEVSVVENSNVLQVSYSDPKSSQTALLANAFAHAYIEYKDSVAQQQYTASRKPLEDEINTLTRTRNDLGNRIAQLPEGNPTAQSLISQANQIDSQIGQLRVQLLNIPTPLAPGEVSAPATAPTSPHSPNWLRNILLALAAGLAVGIGFAFFRESFDDRIRSREELERRIGAPIIAAVPKQRGWKRSGPPQLVTLQDPKSPASESYRTMGTNVQYMASRGQLQVLMVTSAEGGEGKTTTAANLAVVLSQRGNRVILVSADLRKPRTHEFFGVPNDVGLSNVLSRSKELLEAVIDPGVENLRIITGGPIPLDAAALLASKHAATLVNALRDAAEFIVIDTPPALVVADASILAPLTDGTIYVMSAETSSRSAVSHARDQLDNAGAIIVGAVFNNFDPSDRSKYGYYYSSYQRYYAEEPSQNGKRGRLRRGKDPATQNGKLPAGDTVKADR